MSLGSRIVIALFALLTGAMAAAVPFINPESEDKKPACLAVAAVCLLGALACFRGRWQKAALRTLAGMGALAYLAYAASQVIGFAQRRPDAMAGPTNVVKAIGGFVVIGIPAAVYALTGRLLPGNPVADLHAEPEPMEGTQTE